MFVNVVFILLLALKITVELRVPKDPSVHLLDDSILYDIIQKTKPPVYFASIVASA